MTDDEIAAPETKDQQIEAAWRQHTRPIEHRTRTMQAMRTRLAGEQNWRCCWCGIRMRADRGAPDSVTIEHVWPKCLGGSDEYANLAAACYRCNTTREAPNGTA